MVGDPDDHRPNTKWSLAADPDGKVDIALIIEECAVGDGVPLHRHEVDEVVVVVAGLGEVRLGDETRTVGPGTVMFIAAGERHGYRNVGDVPLRLHGIFPTTRLDIEMLERNPAPGTEAEFPRRSVYDARTGEIEVLGPSAIGPSAAPGGQAPPAAFEI